MVEPVFTCLGSRADPYAATPTLVFRLGVDLPAGDAVHAALLRCQIRVEPRRRRYTATEAGRLHDLFGDPSRWADTLQPIQLATVSTSVQGFTGRTEIDLPVPCSYDLEIAGTRYLRGIEDGTVPLLFLFSGTLFLPGPNGFHVAQVPWSAETTHDLPVAVWREAVERCFPHSAWLRVDLDTLETLQRYKSERALPTWDAVLRALLECEPAVDPR